MNPSPEARLERDEYDERVWVDPDGTRWCYPDADEHAASVIANALRLSLPAFDAAMSRASFWERLEIAEWRASFLQAVREGQRREAKAWITLMR